jgi:hypothetical protein
MRQTFELIVEYLIFDIFTQVFSDMMAPSGNQ